MKADPNLPLHLTYCLNIHPGETWDENARAIREHATKVRDRVAPGRRFGLGLRLSRTAAGQLARPAALESFRAFLRDEDLYAFTINGFPFGAFHGGRVKERVYAPDWRQPERRDYTLLLAEVLGVLVPEGVSGSISTVPCSYAAWIQSPADVRAMAMYLLDSVVGLAGIEERCGRELHIGLEPEPDCHVQTVAQAVRFVEEELLGPFARDYLASRAKWDGATAERKVRRHLGVCVDTCHLAVQFEDPVEMLQLLQARGIRVSKIQLSAALRAPDTATALADLPPFRDEVYLHQVRIRGAGGDIRTFPDLGAALDAARQGGVEGEWRVHFHVPLYAGSYGRLESTGAALTPEFFGRVARGAGGVEHLEIETYTFHVLPEAIRPASIDESIAREYEWTLSRLAGR